MMKWFLFEQSDNSQTFLNPLFQKVAPRDRAAGVENDVYNQYINKINK